MNIPADLSYTSDHEWIRRDGDDVKIGITDFAQDSLGDVIFVEAITPGDDVTTGDTISEVESTKSVSDIYAPVSGTIKAFNDALDDAPELLNSDPYGEGWICTITLSDASQLDGLMDAAAYTQFVEGAA